MNALWLGERFPDSGWLAAELHCGPNDLRRLSQLEEISKRASLPLVAAGDVHMHLRSRRRLQDALTAIRLGRPVGECGDALYPNGERHLRPRVRLAQLYPPELLAETLAIAERCDFSLDELRYEYPEELVPPGETPASHLRNLAVEGMARRFPGGTPANVRELVERELALIAELRYEPFSSRCTTWCASRVRKDILCQGRGSAANSAVCYCLGITEVDPENGNMLFERFVSRERDEPPDIDVDFEHERREEVIQYIYGKYGRERAALAATVICYRPERGARPVARRWVSGSISFEPLSGWDGLSVLPERFRELGSIRRARACASCLRLRAIWWVSRATCRSTSAASSSRAGRSPSWCRSRTRRCRSAP